MFRPEKQLDKIRNNLLKPFWQFWKITINRLNLKTICWKSFSTLS